MKKVLFGLLLAGLSFHSKAQISYGGEPRGIHAEKVGLTQPAIVTLPKVNVDSCIAGDEARYASSTIKVPHRFGFNHAVDFSLNNSGVWHTYENGDRLWRITVKSKGAYAINMEFHEYEIPEGGEVFVYNERGQWLGAFTAASNGSGNLSSLGVQPIAGEQVTVEYFEPAEAREQGALKIGQITHAYIDIFGAEKGYGASGSCNNNVICPEGDNWRDEIASVARIISNGNDHCTGQLINNCAEDGHPYFLTADHCLNNSVSNWVFWFNWESPTCTPTSNGPNESISGSTLLANSGATDVALLELSSAPPAAWNPVWTGWDRSGVAPTACVGIHHPAGDIKKITFDTDGAFQSTWQGADVWEVANWEDGTTEGGSSGSGLWNENHRLIGQLFGGSASCSSITEDVYGRFDLSYPVLEPYLGNCGSELGNFPPSVVLDLDANVQSINNVSGAYCNNDEVDASVRVKNNGGLPLSSFDVIWDIDGGASSTINWTGTLNAGQTVDVMIPTQNPGNGSHVINAAVASPNGMQDQNTNNDSKSFNFYIADPGGNIAINITLDDYGTETTWSLADDQGNELYSGGPYQDNMDGTVIVENVCLGAGCFDLTFNDSYDDGMCCQYGDGGFTVTDAANTMYVNNDGQFASSVTENFCFTSVGINEQNEQAALAIYPNPSEGQIAFILPHDIRGAITLQFFDATGRMVLEKIEATSTATVSLDVSQLANGSYSLLMIAGDKRANGRFLLNQ